MRQDDVQINGLYSLKINGKSCKVKVTGRRKVAAYGARRQEKTVFDWVRIDPPPGATKKSGYDTAASFKPWTAG